ncbi:UNVERIFIED_CONTAM: hypothetical protein NY603_18555, partial [Bacteroidetes bacterium 56_B9]
GGSGRKLRLVLSHLPHQEGRVWAEGHEPTLGTGLHKRSIAHNRLLTRINNTRIPSTPKEMAERQIYPHRLSDHLV